MTRDKIFIIAGTQNEFHHYVKNKPNLPDYVNLYHIDQIRGMREVHGVFVGTWYRRHHIESIIHGLGIAGSLDKNKWDHLLDIASRYQVFHCGILLTSTGFKIDIPSISEPLLGHVRSGMGVLNLLG